MPANKEEPKTLSEVMAGAWDETIGKDEAFVPIQEFGAEDEADDKKAPVETQVDPSLATKDDEDPNKVLEDPKVEDPEKVEAKTDEAVVEAPQHWPEADREMFKSQPRAVQDFLSRRHREMEADYTRKTQAASEGIRFSENVTNRIAPEVVREMRAKGVSNEQFVTNLVDWHKLSVTNPAEFARQVVNNLKLDPKVLFEGATPPVVTPAEKRIEQLEARLAREDQEYAATVQNNAKTTLDTFTNEKDAAGNLLRPHLDKVRTMMGRLMMADDTLDLAQAYEVAVFRDPSLRSTLKLPGTTTEQPPVAQSGDNTQRAKEAQRAAAAKSMNIRGDSGSRHAPAEKNGTKPVSLRAAMDEVADELGLK